MFIALEASAKNFLESQNEINENIENESPFHEADQIQISANLDEIRLDETTNTLKRVDALNKDIENLHGIYVDLNTMVSDQKENVNTIEENITKTNEDVKAGLSHLITAHKSVICEPIMHLYKKISSYRFKAATYPISGAVLGGLVGGPIGLVAGFKVGGLAALGCGLAGYTGGKLYRRNCDDVPGAEADDNNKTEEETTTETDIKKDI